MSGANLLQRLWRTWVHYPYWCTVLVVRNETGRLYIFRDVPDWLVEKMATTPYTDKHSDVIKQLSHKAAEEMRLRSRRMYD